MATSYPTSVDALTNPAATDAVTSPSHASQHANANDAIEAIENRLGTGSQTTPGAANRVLRSTSATASEWAALALSTDVTGTLPVANGGTGITSGTSGGIPAFTGTTTIASSAALTANGVVLGGGAGTAPSSTAAGTSNQVFRVPGAGGAPAFGAVDLAQSAAVTGTLPVGNGGTGIASATAFAVLCGGTTSTGAFQSIASVGTSGQVLTSNGAGALPTFQTAASAANEFTHVLTVRDAVLPNTNFPSLDKVGSTFVYEVLGFDATTSEAAYWYIAIPPSVTPATHKITILWTNASGLTTETVQWDVDWRSVSNDEVVDAATTPTTTNDTVSDTWIAQGDVHAAPLTLSTGSNVVADDLLEIKISRDVVNDNLTGDARFIAAVYEITS